MTKQTISNISDRGVVTIDHEIRDLLGIKNKRALIKLEEIEVLKIDDDESIETSDKKVQTVSRINERGGVVIDQELRQMLGIDGEKATIRIGKIEVEMIKQDKEGDHPSYQSPAGDIISLLLRARLRLEHASAAASIEWKHYPPSPKRGAAIVAGSMPWIVLFGILWNLNGVLVIDPLSGDITVTPAAIIGLVIGCIVIIADLPNFDTVEPVSQVDDK